MKNDYLLKNGIVNVFVRGALDAPSVLCIRMIDESLIEYNLEYNHNLEDILEHIIKEIICKSRKLKLEKLNENTK